MFLKLDENKIIKIKDDKKTKIILRLEPFFIEELSINSIEKENFDRCNFNQKHDYNLEELKTISKEEAIKMFKNYIINSYNLFIQDIGKKIMELELEKTKLFDINFDFTEYAVGQICYGYQKDYAVKINDDWYEFSSEYKKEDFAKYKTEAIEEMFNKCSKEEFIEQFINQELLFINLKINKLQSKILKHEESKSKLLNCNFDFLIED